MNDTIIQLQLTAAQARQLYKTGSTDTKTILQASTPAGFFDRNARAIIDACDDPYIGACEYLGIEPKTDEQLLELNRGRADRAALDKLETIILALNDGDYLDWEDGKQRKYSSWFDFSAPSGFAFDDSGYYCSDASAGSASRLCFKREDDARYSGKHPKIAELYRSTIDNKPSTK